MSAAPTPKRQLPVGSLALYYKNGWHAGYVVKWGTKWVKLRHPLGKRVRVGHADVKENPFA